MTMINPLRKVHFKKKGLFFIPRSVIAWVIFSISIAYLSYSLFELNNRSHSISDLLLNFLLQLVITWSIFTTVAIFCHIFEGKKTRF